MTSHHIGQILKELGVIRGDLKSVGTEVRDARADLAEVKAAVRETKREVKLTNGRVTAIEKRHQVEDALKKDKVEARQRWNGWFAPVVTGSVVVVFAAIVNLVVRFVV